MNISIRQGHVLDRLKEIPDNSIDCIITSSPYYGLRNYGASDIVWDETMKCEHQWGDTIPTQYEGGGNRGVSEEWQRPSREAQKGATAGNFCVKCNAWKGELGQEPSYKLFIIHLLQVAKELKRVLKPSGTMFWNLSDAYSGSGGWNWNTGLDEKMGGGLSWMHSREGAYPDKPPSKENDIPRKSQMMIPERFAMGLIDEQGWIKRNTVIWYKRNGMPSSVNDRFTNKWEPIFFFTKDQDYFFDLDSIRKPLSQATIDRITQPDIENQFQTGKVADFAKETQTGDMKKTLLNMQKRQITAMGNEEKRNRFEKKQEEYEGKFSDMSAGESEKYGSPRARNRRKNVDGPTVLSHLNDATPGSVINDESKGYNTKYKESNYGQTPSAFTRLGTLKEQRDQSRIDAEEMFPNDPEKQKEYIQWIHDHYSNPNGANPGDVIRDKFIYFLFSDKAVLSAFMDFLYVERPELLSDAVLEVTTRSHSFAHFAVYPETLVEPLIKAGCPLEVCSKCGKPKVHGESVWKPACKCNASFIPGTVLDPFGGSGTTALVAKKLGRSAILIDAVAEYTHIMRKRLEMDEGETDTEFQEVASAEEFEVDE